MIRRLAVLGILVLLVGCCLRDVRWGGIRPPRGTKPEVVRLETTGYCPCQICCGWKRTWYGKPVVASGPDKGKRKRVGITASGAPAKHGTIAADTSVFPFGTVMHIPGYGFGVVEDRGGAIKGTKIDLYFTHHDKALAWGRQRKEVKVWPPRR